MARWTPDAARRLQEAAVALFSEEGFASVTVGSIAARAGLTERTFFRYFATKEDVLFSDGPAILEQIVDALRSAPADSAPIDVLRHVSARLGSMFDHQRAYHRLRTGLISMEPALLERDLLKHEQWSAAVAEELAARGLSRERATVLAVSTTAAFRYVYVSWSTDRRRGPLVARFNEALENLGNDLTQRARARGPAR